MRRRCVQVAEDGVALVGRQAPGLAAACGGGGVGDLGARTKPSRAWRVSGPAGGSSRASRAVRLTAATAMAAVAGARPV